MNFVGVYKLVKRATTELVFGKKGAIGVFKKRGFPRFLIEKYKNLST